jgi:hypothetical protein
MSSAANGSSRATRRSNRVGAMELRSYDDSTSGATHTQQSPTTSFSAINDREDMGRETGTRNFENDGEALDYNLKH